jgi:DNA-binding SARP family transcriptional activator
MLANYDLDDFSHHALDHPDDRLRATLVVLDAGIAGAWAPLLSRGRHLGLAGLVMGEWPAAERILRLDDEGLLHVDVSGLQAVTLRPCLLSPQAMRELATVVVDEPTESEELESSAPAEPTAGPMVPATLTPPAVGSRVRLQLFGSMRVLNAAGEAVPQPGRGRRATREVLAYLGTHEGWVRKETLRNALWEGEDFKDATDELYAAVSEARRWLVDALADGGEAIPAVSTSGRCLILQKTGQGYRLATELVTVDVSDFDQAFAAAKAQPDSPEALRSVIDAYRGDLLDYADNPDAFTWIEREGLRMVQQKKAAWASIALSEILRSQGKPDQALQILEPLLDTIVNDELWLQALLCEGEAPPRGLGARDRVMVLWRRYEGRLRDLGLYPSTGAEEVYKSLLSVSHVSVHNGESPTKFVRADQINRLGNGRQDGKERVVGMDIVMPRQR